MKHHCREDAKQVFKGNLDEVKGNAYWLILMFCCFCRTGLQKLTQTTINANCKYLLHNTYALSVTLHNYIPVSYIKTLANKNISPYFLSFESNAGESVSKT